MSLVALALRVITVNALRGATYAGSRVFDSAIDPIDQTITEDRNPVVIVYTDEDAPVVHGKDYLGADRRIELVIEAAVASRVTIEGEDEIVIPHTDAGMEAVLSFMERQIWRALYTDQTTWGGLWRQLVCRIERVQSRRGASSEKGVRYAARQIVLTCDTLAEPYFGYEIAEGDFWSGLLAAMRDHPDLDDLAEVLEREMGSPTLTGMQMSAAALGIPYADLGRIGLGGEIPFGNPSDPDDVAGPLTGGHLGEGGRLDDEGTIGDALPPEPEP